MTDHPIDEHSMKHTNRLWREHPQWWILIGLFFGFLIGWFQPPPANGWITSALWIFYGGIWPELIGIFVTVIFIDHLAEQRANRREEQLYAQRGQVAKDEQKAKEIQSLTSELRSEDKATANAVSRKIFENKWFHDGSLKGANLTFAKLSYMNLRLANLSGADLWNANLSGADLEQANLSDTNLYAVNLSGANLYFADLSGAGLIRANLTNASLDIVNLSGADLREANLANAEHIAGATFDKNTTLPDNTKWTPDTDMTRFTTAE